MSTVISKVRKRNSNQIILLRGDYELLTAYFKNYEIRQVNDRENYRKLTEEICRAKVVTKEEFPDDAVRLHSKVIIKDKYTERIMELTLVLPDQADIKQRKISVLAPIGTALLGFREGQSVVWEVPAGRKHLNILSVQNKVLS